MDWNDELYRKHHKPRITLSMSVVNGVSHWWYYDHGEVIAHWVEGSSICMLHFGEECDVLWLD
jgi:metal-dependent HD superfamily phosphatase/phosphodiesterase